MHTHPLGEYMVFIRDGNWRCVADLMLSSAHKLADIGAEFAICPDNTIHEAFQMVEDESRNVGRVHLPAELHELVRSAPLLVLEEPLASRVRRIHRDYALIPARERGVDAVFEELSAALLRLRRRLGGDATDAMVAALRDARDQDAWHDPEAFRPVIEPLLHDYYDPAYRKATPTEGRRLAARGDREELLAWLSATRRPSPA